MFLRKFLNYYPSRLASFCTINKKIVLGIETSCDDTGAAVVDNNGQVLGEALHSQHLIHLRNGGIIPPVAKDLHKEFIGEVVSSAMEMSGLNYEDLDGIAVTTTPGLPLSLFVGTEFAKCLAKKINKPLISINHMEAHALTIRMIEKVNFPFLVLLISGGHSLVAVVENVDRFLLLGTTLDEAPGNAFDKVARRLKLRNLSECCEMNGGQAIEFKARTGNSKAFEYGNTLSKYRDCNFSFSGIMAKAEIYIKELECKHGIKGSELIPNIEDFCASFQYTITKHIVKRLHRAILYCERQNLLNQANNNCKPSLVVSGGVACNQFICAMLKQLCDETGYNLYCPPPKLCTDNGIMIAWNGIEKLKAGIGVVEDIDNLSVRGKPDCPLGVDLTNDVANTRIKSPKFKINPENWQHK